MSKFELKLPKMGESVAEATLTAWLKEIGDTIEFDEPVVEIATDKVDSEVPSEKKGILIEKLFKVDDVIEVGQTIAIIETDEVEPQNNTIIEKDNSKENFEETNNEILSKEDLVEEITESLEKSVKVVLESDQTLNSGKGFLSPLVKNMIKKDSYSILINHKSHEVKEMFKNENVATYEVVILGKDKKFYKFKWQVEKYNKEGPLKNCWLTTAVLAPKVLGSSV